MIPISEPSLSALERSYLLDAFDSGWISSLGPYVERAEIALKGIARSDHAALVSNGTTALHLALIATDIGPGDEVIIPALTYAATLNAVLYVGATPVIVDVRPDTWCIDVAAVESAITSRTRAIIPVDLYGQPADYRGLTKAVEGKAIVVIADAAESIGATLAGRPAGSLADISTFSFFGNKVVTSGEGGAITTNDAALDARVRRLRNQGNHPDIRYMHDMLGYNYRMTNLSAAVLTAQLERLPELLARRLAVLGSYNELLGANKHFRIQQRPSDVVASPWMFSLEIANASSTQRDRVMDDMRKSGVETRPVFRLMQDMPYFTSTVAVDTPVAQRLSEAGISLPTFPGLTRGQIGTVVDSLVRSVSHIHHAIE